MIKPVVVIIDTNTAYYSCIPILIILIIYTNRSPVPFDILQVAKQVLDLVHKLISDIPLDTPIMCSERLKGLKLNIYMYIILYIYYYILYLYIYNIHIVVYTAIHSL